MNLAGDFNGWKTDSIPMRSCGEGWWTAKLYLNSGDYQFRYLADGRTWYTDYAANGVEQKKYGWNSILMVPERAAENMQMPINEQSEILAEAA